MKARHHRSLFGLAVLAGLATTIIAVPIRARGQETLAKRLSSIVTVAVEEYGKAVNEKGRLISQDEYGETSEFFADARQVASTLQGDYAPAARATLDTLVTMVQAKRPPALVHAVHARFVKALGTAGAMELPVAPYDLEEGHTVFTGNCASCHGATGIGNGPASRGMVTPPPAIGDPRKTPDLTATLAYHVMSVGVRNTPMPAFAATLTPQQRWNAINYLYTRLRHQPMSVAAPADVTNTDAERAAVSIVALLDSALDFAKLGKPAEAGDRAFDAYIAFEPLETPARAKAPSVVASMERIFADFKGAVRRSDLHAAQQAHDEIVRSLPHVVSLARPMTGAWEAFWQSLLIIVREGFEAILVIGAVVALLIKMGHRDRLRDIWIGVGLALAASGLTALAMRTLFAALPASQEIIEAVSLLLAVVVLFSVSYWLISKVEAAKWQQFIREKVHAALTEGKGRGALALVAFLAVYREGAETALFYQALFSEGQHLALPLSLGIAIGFVLLAIILVLFYRYGVRIPMRPFFAVTSVLLYYMAFVFAGKGVRELQEGNVVPMTIVPHVPHLDALGIFPTVETLGVQVVLLALFVFALMKTFVVRPRVVTA